MFFFGMLIIVLIVWSLMHLSHRSTHSASSSRRRYQAFDWQDEAVEILQQRFARGEISKSEFERMRRELMS